MKKELEDMEVEEITGGKVILSQNMGTVGFTTLGVTYKIKGDFKKMRNLLYQLQDDNEGMGAQEFDTLVRDAFQARGWI